MIRIHDDVRSCSSLAIQHQARLRVLNVEWPLHKQELLYSREQNVAAYAGVPKSHTAPLQSVHWPTVSFCYYTNSNKHLQIRIVLTGSGCFIVKGNIA